MVNPICNRRKSMAFIIQSLLVSSILSCTSYTPTTPQEYRAWFTVPDNGFIKRHSIGEIHFVAQRRPAELQMLNEIDFSRNYKPAEIESIRGSYGNSIYFVLEIRLDEKTLSALEGKTAMEQIQADERVTFNMAENLTLVAGQLRLKPSLYHVEKSYELGNRIVLLVAFPPCEDDVIRFEVKDDFFTGNTISFDFELDLPYPEIPLKIYTP